MICEWHLCENELEGRQKKYCSKKCKNKQAVTKRRKEVKRKLVEAFGGQCVSCGYNKTYAALQFHHIDPSTKSFGLANKGNTMSFEKAMDEAKKCVLICANCHAESHFVHA